jgi:putative hydroxymethylpyrimidine transport system substrate-binding protein
MRRSIVIAVLVSVVSIAAAGASLTVQLDYLANANHVPLYFGVEAGVFAARGLTVDLVVPTNVSYPVRLAAERAVDIALTPQINYLMARAEGLPLVAVGVLIDHSLGGLLALGDRGVATLADLAGRPIGYSLAPLEPALWRAMFSCVGLPAEDVDLINIGYSTRNALLAGTVDAIGAFRNVELVLPEIRDRQPVFFAQEDFCVPETYDLVFVANPDVVRDRREDVAAFLDGVAESIRATRENPQAALTALFHSFPELDGEADRLSFEATLPLYANDVRTGDPVVWMDMQHFLVQAGLMPGELPFESLVATDLSTTAP